MKITPLGGVHRPLARRILERVRESRTERPASSLRAFMRFLSDDAGAVMAEYALVLSGLTITGVLAFELIGRTANTAVARNTTNLTNTALVVP